MSGLERNKHVTERKRAGRGTMGTTLLLELWDRATAKVQIKRAPDITQAAI